MFLDDEGFQYEGVINFADRDDTPQITHYDSWTLVQFQELSEIIVENELK